MSDTASVPDTAAVLREAEACYSSNNLPQAEAWCRYLQASGVDHPSLQILLGRIAQRIGADAAAIGYFSSALQQDSHNSAARRGIERSRRTLADAPATAAGAQPADRYLLVKAWGYGFWADVDHVLGQLLLAELTGRIPVIHWGDNSLFRTPDVANAFTLYFEPPSDRTMADLRDPGFSYFPDKWNRHNLHIENLDKWTGQYSRMAGLYFLNRHETVAVSDFHTYVKDLLPWIPASSPLYGMEAQGVYRYLFGKYLRLQPALQRDIQHSWENKLRDRHVLAVHVRGSDKILEDRNLPATHGKYHELIAPLLARDDRLQLFLLTDSSAVLTEYIAAYGERLIYNDCERSGNATGIHHSSSDPYRIAREVISDVYLASTCSYFLGTGSSNVSTSILHLRDWQPGQYQLLGHNFLFGAHLTLHNR